MRDAADHKVNKKNLFTKTISKWVLKDIYHYWDLLLLIMLSFE